MGEFEDKLGAILGNQEAMGQIMALAQSIGAAGQESSQQPRDGSEERADQPIASALGDLDPRLMEIGMRALREFQRQDDRKTALLRDLRPFVREERYEKLDRAIQIARLSRVIRTVFDAIREEGRGSV